MVKPLEIDSPQTILPLVQFFWIERNWFRAYHVMWSRSSNIANEMVVDRTTLAAEVEGGELWTIETSVANWASDGWDPSVSFRFGAVRSWLEVELWGGYFGPQFWTTREQIYDPELLPSGNLMLWMVFSICNVNSSNIFTSLEAWT